VQAADAQRCGGVEGGPLCRPALLWVHGTVGRLAGDVMGVEPELPVRRVALELGDAGDEVEQRRGHRRRVDVDPGEVRGPVADGGVEVGAGDAPPLGPAGLVPAGAEHDAGRCSRGMDADLRKGGGKARARVEVETAQRQARGRGVHVGVDEGRSEQRSLPRDRAVGGRRVTG
jgi:hypothetical protein